METVIQRHAGAADAAITHVGEIITQPQPAQLMLLTEDDLPHPPGRCGCGPL